MFSITERDKKNPLVRDLLNEFKQKASMTKSAPDVKSGETGGRERKLKIIQRTPSVANSYEPLPVARDTVSRNQGKDFTSDCDSEWSSGIYENPDELKGHHDQNVVLSTKPTVPLKPKTLTSPVNNHSFPPPPPQLKSPPERAVANEPSLSGNDTIWDCDSDWSDDVYENPDELRERLGGGEMTNKPAVPPKPVTLKPLETKTWSLPPNSNLVVTSDSIARELSPLPPRKPPPDPPNNFNCSKTKPPLAFTKRHTMGNLLSASTEWLADESESSNSLKHHENIYEVFNGRGSLLLGSASPPRKPPPPPPLNGNRKSLVPQKSQTLTTRRSPSKNLGHAYLDLSSCAVYDTDCDHIYETLPCDLDRGEQPDITRSDTKLQDSKEEEEFEEVVDDDLDEDGYLVLTGSEEIDREPPFIESSKNGSDSGPPVVTWSRPVHCKQSSDSISTGSRSVARLISAIHVPKQSECQNKPVEWDTLRGHPWYKPIKRKHAEAFLKQDGRNGAFLIRPAQKGEVCRPLTLSLLLNGEVFNISIRKLKGTGHYALGKEKKDELVFKDVPELVKRHRYEELNLARSTNGSGVGTEAGRTILAFHPN